MRVTMDNMSDVDESGDFAIIPEDEYICSITEIVDGKTKSGDYMATIKLNIKSGEWKDNWVWDNIVCSNKSDSPGYKIRGRTKHFLHMIGEPYESDSFDVDTEKWLWKEVKVKIYHDKYQGKLKPKVAEYLPISDVESNEIPF